ncbi:DUF2235 domain-containing protein [Thalassotalea profundi]|uniref:T6SS Phospholipase effector Tle1-like catalytic domain-containing protein n=1 Tax=Thalassotalea profundi TaxID=2036687 RepID=A0ABQ3IR68_9GAMM|nr:DUF2235 domain-containing protein [Thalassotalea profundi]GHE90217.1 hypothetical protein GCM10011501_19510 [Thalassotalea profundi]
MVKRIVICADGTWNRPEKDLEKDFPTNVLKLARAIMPMGDDGIPQQVFYDWGVGSYYNSVVGGATGAGIQKNIKDDYRYIVQNYNEGDELYFFGFSRGAYTIRSLCGLINNCGILKRDKAHLIEQAFEHYKNDGVDYKPRSAMSEMFIAENSHPDKVIKFVGVWDTVGAMGIPISFLGLFEDEDEFYDTKMGSNIQVARHALAIDEHRKDFIPTIWQRRTSVDIKQVWFCGAHSNIGGSYAPDEDSGLLSDITLQWMIKEAKSHALSVESHLTEQLNPKVTATITESRKSFYRVKRKMYRKLQLTDETYQLKLHKSVKARYLADKSYRPSNLVSEIKANGWPALED